MPPSSVRHRFVRTMTIVWLRMKSRRLVYELRMSARAASDGVLWSVLAQPSSLLTASRSWAAVNGLAR